MRTKTKKLFIALLTALLAATLAIGVARKTDDGNFRGEYDLGKFVAFAAGEDDILGQTKYNVSKNGDYMLLVTPFADTAVLSRVYEVGYDFGDTYEVTEDDKVETSEYYLSITFKNGSTVHADDIFGGSYTDTTPMIVWEITYDENAAYKYMAYVKLGEIIDGELFSNSKDVTGKNRERYVAKKSVEEVETFGFETEDDTPSYTGIGSVDIVTASSSTPAVTCYANANDITIYNSTKTGLHSLRVDGMHNRGVVFNLSEKQLFYLEKGGELSFHARLAFKFKTTETENVKVNDVNIGTIEGSYYLTWQEITVSDEDAIESVLSSGKLNIVISFASAANSNYYLWLDDISVSAPRYTVTLDKDNGEEDEVIEDVPYGTSAAALYEEEKIPEKEGYDFDGWYIGETKVKTTDIVTGDITVKAAWTIRTYTITWLDDGGESLGVDTVEYGDVPSHEDPEKAETLRYIYTFSGWTPSVGEANADETYTATYSAEDKAAFGFENSADKPSYSAIGTVEFTEASSSTPAVTCYANSTTVYNSAKTGSYSLRVDGMNNRGVSFSLSRCQLIYLANGGELSFYACLAFKYKTTETENVKVNDVNIGTIAGSPWPRWQKITVGNEDAIESILSSGKLNIVISFASADNSNYYLWLDDIVVTEPESFTSGYYFVERYVENDSDGYDLYDVYGDFGTVGSLTGHTAGSIANYDLYNTEDTTIAAGSENVVKVYYKKTKQLLIDFEDGETRATLTTGTSVTVSAGDGYQGTKGLWIVANGTVDVQVALTADQITALKAGGTLSFVEGGRLSTWAASNNTNIVINGKTTLHPHGSGWSQYTQMNNRAQSHTITDSATLADIADKGYIRFAVSASGASVTRFVVDDILVIEAA